MHLYAGFGGISPPQTDELSGEPPSDDRLQNDAFRRMEDVELVLRFFAYRQKHRLHKGGPLSAYLDAYLQRGNSFSKETLCGLEELFQNTVVLAEEMFGEKAFWLYRRRGGSWSWFERPTTTVYDPFMFTLSKYLTKSEFIKERAHIFQDRMPIFYQDNYETFEGRNVNPSILQLRDKKFEELFIYVFEQL
jgi:hypothetical protein